MEPGLPGQPDEPLAGTIDELGVGWEHDVLGLNRRVDNDRARVLRLDRVGLDRDAEAFLQQHLDPL